MTNIILPILRVMWTVQLTTTVSAYLKQTRPTTRVNGYVRWHSCDIRLHVSLNETHYVNPCFTYLLTYLLFSSKTEDKEDMGSWSRLRCKKAAWELRNLQRMKDFSRTCWRICTVERRRWIADFLYSKRNLESTETVQTANLRQGSKIVFPFWSAGV